MARQGMDIGTAVGLQATAIGVGLGAVLYTAHAAAWSASARTAKPANRPRTTLPSPLLSATPRPSAGSPDRPSAISPSSEPRTRSCAARSLSGKATSTG